MISVLAHFSSYLSLSTTSKGWYLLESLIQDWIWLDGGKGISKKEDNVLI